MDESGNSPVNLKHRLMGAFILLVLPILVLPWLLGGGDHLPRQLPAKDPGFGPADQFVSTIKGGELVPDVNSVAESAAKQTADADGMGDQASEREVSATTMEQQALESPDEPSALPQTVDTDKGVVLVKSGWLVQVGAFQDEANLEMLETRLAENNMPARREKILIGEKPGWRLLLGPFETKEAAERESGKAILITGEPTVVTLQEG